MLCLTAATLLPVAVSAQDTTPGPAEPRPASPLAPAPAGSPLAVTLLEFDEPQVALLARASGLLEIAPVALPEGENLLGKNAHFGWPVATGAGDAIIVVFHRQTGHGSRQENRPDPHTSRAVATRSLDGGRTWSRPADLRQFIRQPTAASRLDFGNSIITASDGAVVTDTMEGVFRSADRGASWEHLPGAFGAGNRGPVLIEHPVHGLVAFAHRKIPGAATAPYKLSSSVADEIWLRYSRDGGRTWRETKQDLPLFVKPVEPAALFHNGSLIVLARCAAAESFEPATRTWRYVQLWSKDGWLPLQAKLTNIRASDVSHLPPYRSSHGPFSQDTVDVAFNPVTRRLEAVATNRNGGGAGREHVHTHMTLNLWSIDPAKLLAGDAEWRFEGTLLSRRGIMGTRDVDGMHPGAAVIDAQRGVQHLFIYLGFKQGPAGIFRLTRTLDTPKLSRFLRDRQSR